MLVGVLDVKDLYHLFIFQGSNLSLGNLPVGICFLPILLFLVKLVFLFTHELWSRWLSIGVVLSYLFVSLLALGTGAYFPGRLERVVNEAVSANIGFETEHLRQEMSAHDELYRRFVDEIMEVPDGIRPRAALSDWKKYLENPAEKKYRLFLPLRYIYRNTEAQDAGMVFGTLLWAVELLRNKPGMVRFKKIIQILVSFSPVEISMTADMKLLFEEKKECCGPADVPERSGCRPGAKGRRQVGIASQSAYFARGQTTAAAPDEVSQLKKADYGRRTPRKVAWNK